MAAPQPLAPFTAGTEAVVTAPNSTGLPILGDFLPSGSLPYLLEKLPSMDSLLSNPADAIIWPLSPFLHPGLHPATSISSLRTSNEVVIMLLLENQLSAEQY